MQVRNCSVGKFLSPASGAVCRHVTVVMPCFLLTIFSPSFCSMRYFLLVEAGRHACQQL